MWCLFLFQIHINFDCNLFLSDLYAKQAKITVKTKESIYDKYTPTNINGKRVNQVVLLSHLRLCADPFVYESKHHFETVLVIMDILDIDEALKDDSFM